MYCTKCGTRIADGQKFCPSCGVAVTGKATSEGAPVVVVKEKGGCFKGCLIAAILMVVAGVALVMIIGGAASEEEKAAMSASSAVTVGDATKNGEDLIAWIRSKSGMTEMARDDAFSKLKGKTVMLRGKVRQIGNTAFSEEVYVSLTVGQLDMLERINVQFNVRESLAEKVKAWNKDEVHTMRGRIVSKGDLEDDAKCDIAEIVE